MISNILKKIKSPSAIINSVNKSNIQKFELFDTSLRDSLQTLPKESIKLVSSEFKLSVYNEIINNYPTKYIEIGSIVSPKVLPIFNNTMQLLDTILSKKYDPVGIFILIPNSQKMNYFLKNYKHNYNINFSFITSFSNTFQEKNIHKSICDTDNDLINIFNIICKRNCSSNPLLKLYISCFTNCPFEGKIPNHNIIEKIMYYNNNFSFDIICLSDTCGTLTAGTFLTIIEECEKKKIDISKLGIHLHNNYDDVNNNERITNILNVCFEKQIRYYDVSTISHGGCPLAVTNNQLPNLTYEQFFNGLFNSKKDNLK